MKRVLKIILPGILMFCLIFCMRCGKDILTGLYTAFLIPINRWFHMGSCIELALSYTALSCISYAVKAQIRNRCTK